MHETRTARRPRPRRGRGGRPSRSTRSPTAARASAATDGFVVFVRGAVPGRPVRARDREGQALVRRGPRGGDRWSPAPTGSSRACRHPGAPWQVLPYERQLEEKQRQVRDALDAARRLRGPAGRADRAGRRAAALPQQGRVLLRRGRRRRAHARLPPPRPLGRDRRPSSEDVLASERVDELREAVRGLVPRGGPVALRPRDHDGLPAQPRGARGPAHGPAPGAAGHEPGRLPRATSWRRRCRPRACSGPGSTAWPRPPAAARPRRCRATAAIEEQLELGGTELRFRISPDAFFQTNTEMAERLYATAAELAGLTGRERVFDLFCGIGTIALALALEAREVVGVELVERAVADAIENARAERRRQRPLLRGRRAHRHAPAARGGGHGRRGGGRPAARRPVAEGGAARARGRGASGSSTCPATRPRWRPTRARWWTRATSSGRVRPVDMFPQTPHIEAVALLERG